MDSKGKGGDSFQGAKGADFRNPFSNMASPAELDKLVTVQRQGIEALMMANQLVLRCMQLFVRKQMELFDDSSQRIVDAVKNLTSLKDAAPTAEHGSAYQTAVDRSIVQLRDFYDLLARTNSETVEAINASTTDTLEQVHHLLRAAMTDFNKPRA